MGQVKSDGEGGSGVCVFVYILYDDELTVITCPAQSQRIDSSVPVATTLIGRGFPPGLFWLLLVEIFLDAEDKLTRKACVPPLTP